MQLINEKTLKWWVFFATVLAIVMVDIDITAVNLAISTIDKDLHLGLSTAQWVIDGYMISAGALMAFGGRLSDAVGCKRMFLFGLCLFIISSLLVGLANSASVLIFGRILQGASVAFTFPISMVMVRVVFPVEQQGFAVGLIMAIAGFAQALGPTFGGFMIEYFNWRYIFLINIPLSIISIIATYLAVPEDKQEKITIPKNFSLVSLFVMGLLMFMTAINELPHWGVTSSLFAVLLIGGMLVVGIFIYIEFRVSEPILDLRLLLQRDFALLNIVKIIINFIYFSLLFILSLFLQNIIGYSALYAGYLLLFLTLAYGILSVPAGKLVDKIGIVIPLSVGMGLLAMSTFMFAMLYFYYSLYLVIIALLLAGISIGLTIPASGTAVIFSVAREKLGSAMGIFFTTGFIAGSLGVGISGLLLNVLSKYKLNTLLIQDNITLSNIQLNQLQLWASGISHIELAQFQGLISHSFLFSFSIIMFIYTLLAIIACYISRSLRIKSL
jgi:DHA2 family multidrug resistance protein